MTDFLRLRIDICTFHRLAKRLRFFEEVEPYIEDAVTGRHGDADWFDEVHWFFDEVTSVWWEMVDREREGAITLDQAEPVQYLTGVPLAAIAGMGLVEALTLLRKATCARPEIEDYNWNTPGDVERKQDPKRDRRFIAAFNSGLVVAALERLNELVELTQADIEEVLRLKPVFDSLTVEQFRRWNGWEPIELEGGGEALHVPYPEYHPVVREWTYVVWCTPFYIDPYLGARDGDPIPDPKFLDIGVRGHPTVEEFFVDADLATVRQYMAVTIRGEKWCEGHIAAEFARGVIQAAFARLELLHLTP